MKKTKFLQKRGFKESIFLNQKYDSALLYADYETGSVIYSLTKLVQIDLEDLENEGFFDYLPDRQEMFHFLIENFCDFFKELQKRKDGIPPTILNDIDDDIEMAA